MLYSMQHVITQIEIGLCPVESGLMAAVVNTQQQKLQQYQIIKNRFPFYVHEQCMTHLKFMRAALE